MKRTAMKLLTELQIAGYEAYFVGGCVRDMLLGCKTKDFDITTNATPEQVAALFDGEEHDTKLVGAQFPVTMVDNIEIATMRKDHYFTGYGCCDCACETVFDIHEDLSRRDFTVNAIALDPINMVLIDDHDGIVDCINKHLRFVGDAEQRIREDPNRIFRALRFASTRDLVISYETRNAIKKMTDEGLIHTTVSPVRVKNELFMAMASNPQMFMSIIGAFPALYKFLFGADYKSYSSFIYPKMFRADTSGIELTEEERALVNMSVVFSGIGINTGVMHAYSNQEKNVIETLCSCFGMMHDYNFHYLSFNWKTSRRKVLRELHKNNVSIEMWSVFLFIKMGNTYENCQEVFKEFTTLRDDPKFYLTAGEMPVDGTILMERFGIEPGPKLGKIIKTLFETNCDIPEKFSTFEEMMLNAEQLVNVFNHLEENNNE